MQQDGEWCGIGGQNDDLGGTAVESLGCYELTLVSLLQLGRTLDYSPSLAPFFNCL
jgi:hypothetical protein